MNRKRRREFEKSRSVRLADLPKDHEKSTRLLGWLGEQSHYVPFCGVAFIILCVVAIYGQTVRVPPINYEDPVYLVHSPYINAYAAFSGLSSVWNEPYFANFHPVTTTTWLFDSVFADKRRAFDAVPFRIAHIVYYIIGVLLLIVLYRRLGIPKMLAVFGALLYAVHPIHTEVVAWLSARKDIVSLLLMQLSFLAWLWARAAATRNEWRLRYPITILLVLLAVLSKPIAVILPALFVAYEFCSGSHHGIAHWRWAQRHSQPLVTRALALTTIFLLTSAISTVVFRTLLARNHMHGGWLVFVPIGLVLVMATMAPSTLELARFREGSAFAIRVLGPPFVVLSVVFGAGSAWTFWAQEQVGAIKGGLALLPRLVPSRSTVIS